MVKGKCSTSKTSFLAAAGAAALCSVMLIFSAGCSQIEQPRTEPFVSVTLPPEKQEFRWSNGRTPKTFDPALASAPPETDIARAIFEGLTELDPVTLEERPAAAEKWESTDDGRTWTFHLRANAKWSNGKAVTAADFVRSWNRLAEQEANSTQRGLLGNFVGYTADRDKIPITAAEEAAEILLNSSPAKAVPAPSASPAKTPEHDSPIDMMRTTEPAEPEPGRLAVTAENALTLKIRLKHADKDLPKLLAHPIFRPVAEGDKLAKLPAATNGPFNVVSGGPDGVLLERSATYWNKDKVSLEKVRFVPMESTEEALDAYRSGELDAVTNTSLTPLVLKLLTPYEDFRKTAHAALNFYEVNTAKYPFSDRRVRQALANAIERESLTEGEMEGSTLPAHRFLPFSATAAEPITQDKEQARAMLDEAGFPDGENFPVIRLVINRNDTQQRIARLVAQMWKQNLNLNTEIIVKETGELDAVRQSGDYDLIRRGVVFPTADESAAFTAIFGSAQAIDDMPVVIHAEEPAAMTNLLQAGIPTPTPAAEERITAEKRPLTEKLALYEMRSIPLYFPVSYALVKPYVTGFAINTFDAPLLSDVKIDNGWKAR